MPFPMTSMRGKPWFSSRVTRFNNATLSSPNNTPRSTRSSVSSAPDGQQLCIMVGDIETVWHLLLRFGKDFAPARDHGTHRCLAGCARLLR
jgi:hypothetical protein